MKSRTRAIGDDGTVIHVVQSAGLIPHGGLPPGQRAEPFRAYIEGTDIELACEAVDVWVDLETGNRYRRCYATAQ